MTIDLQALLNLPEHCVFGLINDSTKEFYISHTTNLRSKIGAIITEFDTMIKEDTKLVILSSGYEDLEYRRIFAQYYIDKYNGAGYRNFGPSQYINYKVRIKYSSFMSEVLVLLENARGDKTVVGIFSKMVEAEEFVAQYYSGDLIQPVYAVGGKRRGQVYKHLRDSKPKN